MSTNLQPGQPSQNTSAAVSRDSSSPLLSGTNENGADISSSGNIDDTNAKTRKRDFFRFGKKGEEDKKNKVKPPTQPELLSSTTTTKGGLAPNSPLVTPGASSPRAHPYGSPASPGRQAFRSASPRTHSPASSMIFERNVQDEAPAQASSHIPSHIVTEDHIPPALDATSEAITNSKLDPDTVEIVTHASHQPAAASLTGPTHPPADPMVSSIHEDLAASFSRHDADNVSNYGSLDVGDVRRLSFISFADVVHAEQEMGEHHRRDSSTPQMSSLSGHPALSAPRSPSPMRSPLSSEAYGTSPSTSITPSVKGQEISSPGRNLRGPGSPLPGTASPGPVGELNIETMRQALRKTESGDLSGFRSPAWNMTSNTEEGNYERPTR